MFKQYHCNKVLISCIVSFLITAQFYVSVFPTIKLELSFHTTENNNNRTYIVTVSNNEYKEIALSWYKQMTMLGYKNLVVATFDEESHSFLSENNVTVDKILPDDYWPPPIHPTRTRVNRRQIFGTRWMYVLSLLKKGHNVLLSDSDNLFVRYLPMEDLESSKFDIFHAYSGNYPPRFMSMGFTVCGGMSWFRASLPSIRYVETFLHYCGGWNHTYTPVYCDDQLILNKLIFDKTINFTFDGDVDPTSLTDVFWKPSLEGTSEPTGLKFKIWDVNTAYRGPVNGTVNGTDGVCPKNNWVTMPYSRIVEPNGTKNLPAAVDREIRKQQWRKYCPEETNKI